MKKNKNSFSRGLIVTLLVFALLFCAGLKLISSIETRSSDAEAEIVAEAIRSAVLTCYAVEGSYPGSLTYLKDNYGLAYNEDNYIVSYDVFASNIMPVIRVLERGNNK